MSDSCPSAYASGNNWFTSKEECEKSSCNVNCNKCNLSGYTQEYYACTTSQNEESGMVYGNLAGGNQGTYILPGLENK